MKLFSSHKKKFFWLLHRSKLNETNKIKLIKFNYITNLKHFLKTLSQGFKKKKSIHFHGKKIK